MIKFIGKKKISPPRIEELLKLSEATNDYTNDGPVKGLLENKLQSLLDIDIHNKKVVCFNNGTSALHGIMLLCQKKYNIQRWVTPAFTFPSVVVGGIFNVDVLDINFETGTLEKNPELLAPYGGIVLTNLFGSYVDIPSWEKFCRKNNKILVFDNASSPLSKYEGVNICNFGDYSFGSLHHTKYLGFGEGGFAIIPSSDYRLISQLTNFGYDEIKKYHRLSSNFKMSDVSAAYILSQVENYDIERHLKIQEMLIQHINKNKKMKIFNYKDGTIYGNIPVVFPEETDNNILTENTGIEIFKYYRPLTELGETVRLYSRMINFPIYSTLSDTEIRKILDGIKKL